MTRGDAPAGAKRGFLEYLLLTLLFLVVGVTAWTLWDNGVLDTLGGLIAR